jgi:hypothetical protein
VTLAETQALFHAAVTRAEGDRTRELERCFAGTAGLQALDRVGIYADMYLWRLVDALREDYPKLAALLGDEGFYALTEVYVRAHPSEHHDLGQLGRRLPAYVRELPAARPDLADLAALEWARAEVFFEAEARAVGREALAVLSPERFLGARLRLAPALRLLVLEHGVVPLWRALEGGQPPPPPAPGTCAVAVWREGFEVFHASLDLDEALALEAAASGDPLPRVCAAFARRDDPAGAAFAALSGWLKAGWIAGVEAGGRGEDRP